MESSFWRVNDFDPATALERTYSASRASRQIGAELPCHCKPGNVQTL